MTIATTANLRLVLGLSTSITSEEWSLLTLLQERVESAVERYLGYDPEQSSRTEYYPRHDLSGGVDVGGVWDVNSAQTRAVWERYSAAADTLQLRRLPVRRISALYVDTNGRFGKGSGAFPASTLYTEGSDFWAEYEEDYHCPNGLLRSYGSWPIEPGSVKVTYTAGYSALELAGSPPSASTLSDANSQVSTAGLDASQITRAVEIGVVQAFNRWALTKKHTGSGFGGPLQSESAGEYSYSRGNIADVLAGDLPSEALDRLEPFRSYGVMRA